MLNPDSHKLVALKSWGLEDDESVIDCDPGAMTVTFANGDVRQRVECWSRVMGYHRPISQWNKGKQQEHKDRVQYNEVVAEKSMQNLPAPRHHIASTGGFNNINFLR